MIPVQSSALERSWKAFFPGSYLFEDIQPGIDGVRREGLEEGVDLFLPPEWREYLPTGLIQIKASPAEARNFLEVGFDRKLIIPVVVGPVPFDKTPKDVLSRLRQDYCWLPSYKTKDETTIELEEYLRMLTEYPEESFLRTYRPKWALGLA